MIDRLFIATTNRHKLAEIRSIFNRPALDLLDMSSMTGLPEVEEDRDTFRGNAEKKARELAVATGLWALADDSGLEVDALEGAPGVLSARYAGEPADDEANNRKLLGAMEGVANRTARFRCAIALSDPEGRVSSVEARCEGRIADAPRGRNGFGYDPLFIPEGSGQTFAEMDEAEKNRISHRGRALELAAHEWTHLFCTETDVRRVLVLINPKSGWSRSFDALRGAFEKHWAETDIDVIYQFTQSAEDGDNKVRRAVRQGVDTVLIAGGDGTVSTVGRALVGTPTTLGVIPTGSGNGFARHFGIPTDPERAVKCLADAEVKSIDVGIVNHTMFFVTCSMAWDAALVRSFEKAPVRGVLPYVFAGVHEFFQYEAQDIAVDLDATREEVFRAPMVFTIANMTQFGGGARIAPQARPDDGLLELVVALRQDTPKLIGNLIRLFDGSIAKVPEVTTRRFRAMRIRREKATPIQMDGELVDAPREIDVRVRPGALRVLVPRHASPSRNE